MTEAVRVFLVEDHPVFRLGTRALLEDDPEYHFVGEAGDLREARAGITELHPDLVLVDLVLQEGNGIELLPWLRSECPDVKVLVVSMLDETLYAERCVRSGANGYLQKSQAPTRLFEAVERVMSGQVYLGASATRRMVSRVAGGTPEVQDPVVGLSDRELEVFQLIGQGYRTPEIARALCLSPKTIETHQGKIRRKLGVDSSLELVRLAVTWVEHGGQIPYA